MKDKVFYILIIVVFILSLMIIQDVFYTHAELLGKHANNYCKVICEGKKSYIVSTPRNRIKYNGCIFGCLEQLESIREE